MTRTEYAEFQARHLGFKNSYKVQQMSGSGETVYEFRTCPCCLGAADRFELTTGVKLYRGDGARRKRPDVVAMGLVCEECLYYEQYGQLDDMTMLDIAEDE